MDAKERSHPPTFSLRAVLIMFAFLGLLLAWWVDRSRLIESLYEQRFLISLNEYKPGTVNRVTLRSQVQSGSRTYHPTVEIAPASVSGAFLQRNEVHVEINRYDMGVIDSGNFVTKVVYVPTQAPSGHFATMTATSISPHGDPIVESSKKGKIVAVVRIGNKDVK